MLNVKSLKLLCEVKDFMKTWSHPPESEIYVVTYK